MSLEQQQTIQDTADVAEEKDKMDLRPAIDFIEKNQQVYHKLTREIFAESQPTPVFQWARSLRFKKGSGRSLRTFKKRKGCRTNTPPKLLSRYPFRVFSGLNNLVGVFVRHR